MGKKCVIAILFYNVRKFVTYIYIYKILNKNSANTEVS